MKKNPSSTNTQPNKIAPGPNKLLNFWDDPLTNFKNFTHKYGDIVCLDPKTHRVYLINHPNHIKLVLQDHHHNYIVESDAFKVVIGNGLAVSQGELWLRQRRIMQPAFHHRSLNNMFDTMLNTTTEFIQQWDFSAEKLDVLTKTTDLAINISSRAMFGTDLKNETDALAQALTTAQEYVYYHGWDTETEEKINDKLSNEEIQFQEAINTIDDIVYRIINERRSSKQNHNDLLEMLLHASDENNGGTMSEKQLRDETVTMLAGGQSTTANALAWILYVLACHPEEQDRLYKEVMQVLGQRLPAFQDLSNLVYTQMIIDEVLRLYPPSWLITRRSIKDDNIGGYDIPGNSQILISPYIIHRHPRFWSDPESFNPERFAPGPSDERPHFAYIPFSAGPRICIGNKFALIAIELALIITIQRYSLSLISQQPIQPNPLILLEPQENILIKLHKR